MRLVRILGGVDAAPAPLTACCRWPPQPVDHGMEWAYGSVSGGCGDSSVLLPVPQPLG